MTDSLSEHDKQHEKQRAIRFALKLPAGHLSAKTPVAIAVREILKDRPKKPIDLSLKKEVPTKESIKTGALNALSPIELKRTLNSINPDWINWLPETIWTEFPCEKTTKEKIRAIQTVLTTPDTQFDVDAFSHIIEAFNGHIPDWSVLYPLPCEELVYGWNQLKLIRPDFELWDDVISYIKACMVEDGIIYLPWLNIEEKRGIEFNTDALKVVWSKQPEATNMSDVMHVQIAKLYDIKSYLESMS